MKREVNRYSDEFKLKIVKEYLSTDASIPSLMDKYNIRGSSCITNWIRKFESSTQHSIESIKESKRMDEMAIKSKRERELEEKIKNLEKELDYEKLKTLALDTLIDVAERDLKIPIRKKPGAKQ